MKAIGEDIDQGTIDLMIEGVDQDGDGEIDFNGDAGVKLKLDLPERSTHMTARA